MISLVLYGRNDSYGYNLHKRAALSLNCMAEVLTGEDDEILFVDYNTPDDYPTFPEAIADTLTDHAARVLRVLRVRPATHRQRFADKTHLKALEPVSRNVAIRRSNPANRWVLSTNTDMIFVPRRGDSLTDAVAGLGDGFYCTPRFEIPETLWEAFDRRAARDTIEATRRLGEALHLNEIVRGSENILYDAPGDFQLMLRSDLFDIHGFHEGMLRGWHLDSNISRRLRMIHGAVGDAVDHVFGYHCDHTRQVTPMHAPNSAENSIREFVDDVTGAGLPAQADTWGLAGETVEEIDLARPSAAVYQRALEAAVGGPAGEPFVASYTSETYRRHRVEPEHVLPFLLDLFVNAPADLSVGWCGPRDRIFDLFVRAWTELGRAGEVVPLADEADVRNRGNELGAFVANFGVPEARPLGEQLPLYRVMAEVIAIEKQSLRAGAELRRVVGINAIHNDYERFMKTWFGCARTPFSARLRHGFLVSDAVDRTRDAMPTMMRGAAAVRGGDAIVSDGTAGHVFFGPYLVLLPGSYEAVLGLTLTDPIAREAAERQAPRIVVDVVAECGEQEAELEAVTLPVSAVAAGEVRIPFRVAENLALHDIQIRLYTDGLAGVRLDRLVITDRD